MPSFVGSAATPAHNGSSNAAQLTITPPGSMQVEDLVLVIQSTKTNTPGFVVGVDGGQSWIEIPTDTTSTNRSIGAWWARFDGTWDANPRFDATTVGNAHSAVMYVFRPDSGMQFSIDVDGTPSNGSAPTTPFDITITGVTATGPAYAVAIAMSIDENELQVQTGGWTGASFDNQQGSNLGLGIAYQWFASGGATGDVVFRQTDLAGDSWMGKVITFVHEAIPATTSAAVVTWSELEVPAGDPGEAVVTHALLEAPSVSVIERVQFASDGGGLGYDPVVTFATPATTGNTLIAIFTSNQKASQMDPPAGTWTLDLEIEDVDQVVQYYRKAAVGGETVFTFSNTDPDPKGNFSAVVIEYAATLFPGPLDTEISAGTTSVALSITSPADTVMIGAVQVGNSSGDFGPPSGGFNVLADGTPTNCLFVADLGTDSAATFPLDVSWVKSRKTVGVLMIYAEELIPQQLSGVVTQASLQVPSDALPGDPWGCIQARSEIEQPSGAVLIRAGIHDPQTVINAHAPGTTYWFDGVFNMTYEIIPKEGDTLLSNNAVLDGGAHYLSGDQETRGSVLAPGPDTGIKCKFGAGVGVLDVTIRGFEIRKYRIRAIEPWVGGVVRHCFLHDNYRNGTGAGFNHVPNNGGASPQFTIEDSCIWNNGAADELGSGSGGIKHAGTGDGLPFEDGGAPDIATPGSGTVTRRVYFWNNIGNGIWIDVAGGGDIIEDVISRGNGRKGVYYEVCDGPITISEVTSEDNVTWRAEDGPRPHSTDCNIGAMTSMWVTIENCRTGGAVEKNHGILLSKSDREVRFGHGLEHVVVQNNNIRNGDILEIKPIIYEGVYPTTDLTTTNNVDMGAGVAGASWEGIFDPDLLQQIVPDQDFYIEDTFSRADSSTLGLTEIGQEPWIEPASNASILSGVLRSGNPGANCDVLLDFAPNVDYWVEADLIANNSYLAVRWVDSTPFESIWAGREGTNIKLYTAVAGTVTERGTYAYGGGNVTLRCQVIGNDVSVFVAGTLRITYVLTQAELMTSTMLGVRTNTSDSSFADNVKAGTTGFIVPEPPAIARVQSIADSTQNGGNCVVTLVVPNVNSTIIAVFGGNVSLAALVGPSLLDGWVKDFEATGNSQSLQVWRLIAPEPAPEDVFKTYTFVVDNLGVGTTQVIVSEYSAAQGLEPVVFDGSSGNATSLAVGPVTVPSVPALLVGAATLNQAETWNAPTGGFTQVLQTDNTRMQVVEDILHPEDTAGDFSTTLSWSLTRNGAGLLGAWMLPEFVEEGTSALLTVGELEVPDGEEDPGESGGVILGYRGDRAELGWSLQSSKGNPGSNPSYMLLDFPLTALPEPFQSEVVRTGAHPFTVAQSTRKGMEAWRGGFSTPAWATASGPLLKGILPSESVVSSGGQWQHRFTPGTGEQWLTLFSTRPVSLHERWVDGLMESVTVDFASGQPINLVSSIFGLTASILAGPWSAGSTSVMNNTSEWLSYVGASVKVDVASTPAASEIGKYVESGSIAVIRATEMVPRADRSIAWGMTRGNYAVNIALNMTFQDYDFYRATFYGGVGGSAYSTSIFQGSVTLRFRAITSQNLYLEIDVPKAQFWAEPPQLADGFYEQTIQGQAIAGGAYLTRWTLQNGKSTAY